MAKVKTKLELLEAELIKVQKLETIAKTKATDATVKLQCAKAAVAGVKEDIKLEKASLKAKK